METIKKEFKVVKVSKNEFSKNKLIRYLKNQIVTGETKEGRSVIIAYNANGLESAIIYRDGDSVAYLYDDENRIITTIKNGYDVHNYTYKKFGNITVQIAEYNYNILKFNQKSIKIFDDKYVYYTKDIEPLCSFSNMVIDNLGRLCMLSTNNENVVFHYRHDETKPYLIITPEKIYHEDDDMDEETKLSYETKQMLIDNCKISGNYYEIYNECDELVYKVDMEHLDALKINGVSYIESNTEENVPIYNIEIKNNKVIREYFTEKLNDDSKYCITEYAYSKS